MNCEIIQEQLEAFALGALEPAEEQQVTQHLQQCPECAELLRQYQEVAAILPELLVDTTQHPLSPAVKERLMQRLEAGETGPFLAEKPTISPATRPQKITWPGIRWPIWAGTAVLFISLLWLAQSTLFSNQSPDSDLQAIIQQQTLIQEVVESNETLQLVLEPQEYGMKASGRLYTNPKKPTLVLTATGLPQPPEGEGYFVWYGSDEEYELVGSITVNEDGFGLIAFESDEQETMEFAQIAVQPVNDLTTGKLVLRWAKE